MLAEIGYPMGDESLLSMRDQVARSLAEQLLLHGVRIEERRAEASERGRRSDNPGALSRCASQQGNALYSITRLGLADERSDGLAERLMHWQWPMADGIAIASHPLMFRRSTNRCCRCWGSRHMRNARKTMRRARPR